MMAFHKNIPSAILLTKNHAELLKLLVQAHSDPVDSYWNGSHTWFTSNADFECEWRLHPVSSFKMPQASRPEDLFELALEDEVDPQHYWEGLEIFPISDEICSLEDLKGHIDSFLNLEPDFIGLVDHESIGNSYEQKAGNVSIIQLLIEQINENI